MDWSDAKVSWESGILVHNFSLIKHCREGVEFLKSELNSYSVCEFRGLTF